MNWLLQAVLLEPEKAIGAYGAWKKQVNFEALQTPEFNLLPKLYQNLSGKIDDELTPRLRGIYKQHWSQQQQRLRQQSALLERLNKLEYSLLDDVALALATQTDILLKSDFDQLLQQIPSEFWRLPKHKYRQLWQTRGWVSFTGGLRVFSKAPSEIWLHRFNYCQHDLLWLVRAYPTLKTIGNWQPWLEPVAELGLQKRLSQIHWLAASSNLLLMPLPEMHYSSFDQCQFQKIYHPWRYARFYYRWRVAQQQGDKRSLVAYFLNR